MLPYHPSLEGPRNFICVFPEPESALAFPVPLSSILPAPSSPSPSPLPPSSGQCISPCEGGARSL